MAELISCPECQKHLQVPQELIGQQVQCPECTHIFVAALPNYSAPADKPTAVPVPKETKRPEWEDDDPPPTSSKKPKDDDLDFNRENDGVERRPRRRRRSSSGGGYDEHRGGMILAFGLVGILAASFFPIGLIFAILAWVMGNSDMDEIRRGRMDPEGEGMTQAGRIMGIVATILQILGLLTCCGLACLPAMLGAMAGPGPRRRF